MTDARPARRPFFTIGHAALGLPDFIAVLQGAGVQRLVDVRAFPRSRSNPQFNLDTLPAALAAQGIDYEHMADLGGRRGRQPGVAPEVNGAWDNESFHHYADWALQPAFGAALAHLRETGQRQCCAVMCAESLWWRCHRRIIADHLLATGETVRHIMDGHVEDARPTPFARVAADGLVRYPSDAPGAATPRAVGAQCPPPTDR